MKPIAPILAVIASYLARQAAKRRKGPSLIK